MSKLTDVLKGFGIGAVTIGAGVWIGKKLTESANKEAVFNQKTESMNNEDAFNQKLEEEDIYDVKNEMDINILREKHRMKMEAERQKNKEFLTGMAILGGIAALGLLIGLISWFAEHMFLLIGLLTAVFISVITAIVLRHKRLMRQHDIDILKTNVSTMGESEAERLAKKYQEK